MNLEDKLFLIVVGGVVVVGVLLLGHMTWVAVAYVLEVMG